VERLALAALDARDIHAEGREVIDVTLWEVVPDDGDHVNLLGEVGRDPRDERRRATEQVLVETERAVDVIERDRANDEE
jgi:hypothetical protein